SEPVSINVPVFWYLPSQYLSCQSTSRVCLPVSRPCPLNSVCVSTDGSRRRNPPERCPRPLCPQDCPEENHNIPEDHQGEDLIDIKVEIIHGAQEAIAIWADQQDGSMRRNPPERCPRPLCPQDCPEENHNIPEDH
ncbi:unnamed protein product, partial [Ranitomeya imitator]